MLLKNWITSEGIVLDDQELERIGNDINKEITNVWHLDRGCSTMVQAGTTVVISTEESSSIHTEDDLANEDFMSGWYSKRKCYCHGCGDELICDFEIAAWHNGDAYCQGCEDALPDED